ncbi:MAG: FAD-dependent oxidoreductase [Bacteroidota bacterium]|nr:FAD-dependent oxidoreductase [Bacteroidota bacterium]
MKDVCVIGGGIVGLCSAYFLHGAGLDVTIIDKGDFTTGCSFGNAGMIVPSHFTPLASPGMMTKGIQWMFQKKSPFFIRPRLDFDLLRWLWLFDRSATRENVEQAAPVLRDMHLEGKEFYHQLNQSDGFDFGMQEKGILMLYQTEETEQEEEETADVAYTLGIEAKKLSHSQLQSLERGTKIDARGGIYYPGDAHLHPEKLMQQLKAFLEKAGVLFIAGEEVLNIEDKGVLGCDITTTGNQKWSPKNVVIACGSWTGKLVKQDKKRLPIQDGKGYSMTFTQPASMPSIPSILVDARVAITPMAKDLRISGTLEISGMDDKIRMAKVSGILGSVPEYYPDLKFNSIPPVWYGYRPCSPDGLPYIGRGQQDSSIIIASGHAMMGLSLAPSTGRMIRDCIIYKKQLVNPILNPSRFS